MHLLICRGDLSVDTGDQLGDVRMFLDRAGDDEGLAALVRADLQFVRIGWLPPALSAIRVSKQLANDVGDDLKISMLELIEPDDTLLAFRWRRIEHFDQALDQRKLVALACDDERVEALVGAHGYGVAVRLVLRSAEPAAEEEKERLLVVRQIVDELLNRALDLFGFGVLQLKDTELKRLRRLWRIEL